MDTQSIIKLKLKNQKVAITQTILYYGGFTVNEILELKRKIEAQKEKNIKLYKSIPLASKEDPLNKKAEPILNNWREGGKVLRNLMKELEQLETTQKKQTQKDNNQVFINSYGEATQRKISTSTYDKQQKRLSKDMLLYMGNR